MDRNYSEEDTNVYIKWSIKLFQAIMMYIIPILYLIGLIPHLINVIVFISLRNELKKVIYKYLATNSFIDLLTTILTIGASLTTCQKPFVNTYYFRYYHLYILIYLTPSLYMISSFINIKIAFDRYCFLSNNCVRLHNKSNFNKYLFAFILISFLLNAPNLISNEILKVDTVYGSYKNSFNNQSENQTHLNDVYNNERFQYIIALSGLVKQKSELRLTFFILKYSITFAFIVAMVLINFLVYHKFKTAYKGITELAEEQHETLMEGSNITVNRTKIYLNAKLKEKQTTLMIFWLSVIFIASRISNTINNTLYFIYKRETTEYNFVVLFSLISFLVFHFLNLIIYYKFNRNYQQQLKRFILN